MAFIARLFPSLHSVPSILVLCLVALIAWRLWRFTVVPFLFPKEPKVLPYWIPGACHAVLKQHSRED